VVQEGLREQEVSYRQGLENLVLRYDKCLKKFGDCLEKQRTDGQMCPSAFLHLEESRETHFRTYRPKYQSFVLLASLRSSDHHLSSSSSSSSSQILRLVARYGRTPQHEGSSVSIYKLYTECGPRSCAECDVCRHYMQTGDVNKESSSR
jgi:hypothetical protein